MIEESKETHPIKTFPRHLPKVENVSSDRRDSVVVFGGWDFLPVCFGVGLVSFLLAHVSWIPQ